MRCRRCWSDHWGCRTSPIWGRGCRGRGFSCHSIKFQLAAGSSWKQKVFISKKLLSSWEAGIRQSLVYRSTLWSMDRLWCHREISLGETTGTGSLLKYTMNRQWCHREISLRETTGTGSLLKYTMDRQWCNREISLRETTGTGSLQKYTMDRQWCNREISL